MSADHVTALTQKRKIAVVMPEGTVRDTFIPPEVVKKAEAIGEISWNTLSRNYETDELNAAIKDADICISGWGCKQFDRDVLKGVEKLKIIAHTGGSVAPVVSEHVYARGIKVISGNKLYAESVAEGVVGYILAALRDIPRYSYTVKTGGWAEENFYNEGLLEQTIGLVGFGAIARYLVAMLRPFRNRIKVYDPFVSDEACAKCGVERVESIEEIFASCKIISLHIPGVPENYHIIDQKLITSIPDGALLVNTARGIIIDEEALAEELQKGRFKAVLDVYETEPLAKDSKLRGLDNAILMPHMAGPTIDRRKQVTFALLEDIERYYAGGVLEHEIPWEYARTMTNDAARRGK